MKSHRLLQILFGIVFSLLSIIGSSATPVTFNFAGNVTAITDANHLVQQTSIHIGSPVQGSLRFDTTTPDWPLYVDDPTRGQFVGPGWLKLDIAGLRFEKTTSVQVDILHGANGGQELFEAFALGSPTAWPIELPATANQMIFMAFWETAPPYDLLSNAELPTSMDFSRADTKLAFVRASSALGGYEIKFSLIQVPEPSVAALLAATFALWRFSTRRNCRQAQPFPQRTILGATAR